ncbi:MAG: hypothetical protein C0502_09985 [Opitutus sp.]|nr:hypothetical protein [Opitutus sp.]
MRTFLRPFAALTLTAAAACAGTAERTQQNLRQLLPKFDPVQAEAARQTEAGKVARPAAEEGVIVLPDFNVVEKKVPQPGADQWFTDAEITRREMRRAEADMNGLEMALNRWHIPYLSASFAERARAGYEARKFREKIGGYLDLARKLEKIDPKAAKKIRDSLDFGKLPKDND